MLKAIGVIPARYGSTRYPGKPLALINGKPLIQWVVEGTLTSKLLQKVVVATDDERIAQVARASGAEVVMTSSDLPSGTDRVWAAALEFPSELVLNVQGDEPLIEGHVLDLLVETLQENPQTQMATFGISLKDEEVENLNVAKILLNKNTEAIYFSRFAIPFSREKIANERTDDQILRHIGIYGYRSQFLKEFCAQPVVLAEKGEALEQLRALYLGAKIKVVPINHVCWGVDTPEDVLRVEKMMKEKVNG